MNEGWAMYWEKEIMLKLFEDKTVNDIVDYAKCFSGVCYPRPFFQRNPYQLGFNMWHRIKDRYKKGIYTTEYYNEKDSAKKELWDKPLPPGSPTPMEFMESIVKTNTDYNFIKRFLTDVDVRELYLNRVPLQYGINWNNDDLEDLNEHYAFVKPKIVKDWMLEFFTSYHRPRIYIIDTDFNQGGLLLFHRPDGKKLRKEWIFPTCSNISAVWKSPVHIISNNILYSYNSPSSTDTIELEKELTFDQIVETMKEGNKVKI
jgi:stage V sporulation protein R